MSHTYTRTAALLGDFAQSLAAADLLFFLIIYASAREQFNGKIDGRSLYDAAENLKSGKPEAVYYTDEPLDAFEPLKNILKPGDLFLTLGAGSNWPLGLQLYEHYRDGAQ
jgi:UDP-N-acetylmuramate--alanine ligase